MPVDLFTLLLVLPLGVIHATAWGILLSNLAFTRRRKDASLSSPPSLSVCIPARNEADNLRRLLPSLQMQTYPNVEFLIWDDGSEDDTWAVLDAADDSRLTALKGEGPPDGWVGKVHALYQCTRQASGDCYLFLDADAELQHPDALQRLVARHVNTPGTVSSGLPHLRGGALLLVSLVPHLLLRSLPWSLVPRTQSPMVSALNGQCWMIDSDVYHDHEPHLETKDEVLEDVAIGRYLKDCGHPPSILDLQDLVAIYMYDGYATAWPGFRKNAYLLLGGSVPRFVAAMGLYILGWLVAPVLSLWFLASLYGLKFVTDRASGMPLYVSVLAPVSYVLGLLLALDSAVHHWTGRVTWKGRSVPSATGTSLPDADNDTSEARVH